MRDRADATSREKPAVRVAAIDCGTNSVRLLVAETTDDASGPMRDLAREMRVVRLGQDVDRTGRLAPEALARTRAALTDYAATIQALQVDRVRFVATSATRDATNRADFIAIVRATVGVAPEVVTGQEEAGLSFTGAAAVRPGADDLLVVDIGGGSTEFVRARPGQPLQSVSVDVGAVRMTERHLRHDPPTPAELERVRADVDAALDQAGAAVDLTGAGEVIAVAGTATTVAAIALGLTEYDSARINGAEVAAADVGRIQTDLAALDHDARAAIRVIHPGRVDVIVAGATILRRVVERTGADPLVASEHDILDGIALSLLG